MAFALASETRGLSAVGSVIFLIRTSLSYMTPTRAFVAGVLRQRPALAGDMAFSPAQVTRSNVDVISGLFLGVDAVLFHVTALSAFEADLMSGLVGTIFGDVTFMLAEIASHVFHAVFSRVTDALRDKTWLIRHISTFTFPRAQE